MSESIFTFLATSDISSRIKGRSVLTKNYKIGESVGWVPANIGITNTGHIAEGLPYRSAGDLRLRADDESMRKISGIPETPDGQFVFADVVKTNGDAWSCCPRTILKDAIQELSEEFNLSMTVSFEHEFSEKGLTTPSHPFSYSRFLDHGEVGKTLVSVLESAGIRPETWLPEYGEHQYEITMEPEAPLRAADNAVLIRELTRQVYKSMGKDITFSPVPVPGGAGTGVHIHYGLYGPDGEAVAYAPDAPGRMSSLAGKFNAGIIKYGSALTAFFAPLPISYDRLKPNNWSTAKIFCGLENREALLRICPTNEIGGKSPAEQFHFEFRGGDAGANPWLLLAVLIKAGLEGIRQDLPPVEIITEEPDFDEENSSLQSLPESLSDALQLLEDSETVTSWFSNEFLQTYIAVKQQELNDLEGKSFAELCEVYSNVY